MGETKSEDLFKILLATDIHLGYNEKDPIRGDDSYNTFEEILQVACARDVDFILLGGDLFHENKPSLQCLHRCLALLRKYCLGDKPINIEFLSDQAENFKHCVLPIVNYEDPNYNVSIPVFSIHGNHDDPSGFGRKSALDLVSTSGLINYFGKCTDLSGIRVVPLLLQKGASKLAIYGLSHVKDERLARLFRDERVVSVRPPTNPDDYVNVFVLHQNRVDRGPNNFIKENMLPDFIDLVFWGHEHECKIDLDWNNEKKFYVTQPGSPVATSLCEGETVTKHVGLLKLAGKKFKLEPIKLQTVRPIVFDTVVLSECSIENRYTVKDVPAIQIKKYLTEKIESMMNEASSQLTDHPKQPTLPLIRLRVEYLHEYQYFNPIRFGQMFTDRVANPMDMVLLKRETKRVKKGEHFDKDTMDNIFKEEPIDTSESLNVGKVLENYFKECEETKQLKILSVKGLGEAVSKFVDSGDKDSIGDICNHQMKKTIEYLKKQEFDTNNIIDFIDDFRKMRMVKTEEEVTEVRKLLSDTMRSHTSIFESPTEETTVCGSNSDEEFQTINTSAKQTQSSQGRGRRGSRGGRGAGSRGGRGSRGRAKATADSWATASANVSFNSSISSRNNTASRKVGQKQQSIADIFNFDEKTPQVATKRRKVEYISDSDSD